MRTKDVVRCRKESRLWPASGRVARRAPDEDRESPPVRGQSGRHARKGPGSVGDQDVLLSLGDRQVSSLVSTAPNRRTEPLVLLAFSCRALRKCCSAAEHNHIRFLPPLNLKVVVSVPLTAICGRKDSINFLEGSVARPKQERNETGEVLVRRQAGKQLGQQGGERRHLYLAGC